MASCVARTAARGGGPCPATSRYTPSSIANHSARQSLMRCCSREGIPTRPGSSQLHSVTSNRGSKMFQQVTKLGDDHQFAAAALQFIVFQYPRGVVRHKDGVQARL